MENGELIYLASKAFDKDWDYEDLCNVTEYTDQVWEYVTEIRDYGMFNFKEKYKDYKLYF